MTTKTKTVLVLGAGASHGYGFPIGSQLRQKILALRDSDEASNDMGFGKGAIRKFVDAFMQSQSYSIDSFLGRRQEFVEIGKAAIAYVLLTCEQSADLTNDENKDHWYQLLVNEIATNDWDTFDPSWLSVVTFNYDRSLLQYLINTLQHIYNKRLEEVSSKLSTIKMIHVYGRLGELSGIPFGGLQPNSLDYYVREAAKSLVIIPEGRDDSPTVIAAQELIKSAERICFLGFGFDATNVRRLGAPDCFLNKAPNQHPPKTPKRVVATCLGLTDAEVGRAIQHLFSGGNLTGNLTDNFLAMNCIRTLRESLILD